MNPDNGGQARLAARCAAESHGRYRIRVEVLPQVEAATVLELERAEHLELADEDRSEAAE